MKTNRRRWRSHRVVPPQQAEILEHRVLLSSVPIAHWTFDDPTGTTAIDSSGHSADGVVTGAISGPGAIGDGFLFDGVNDSVVPGTEASLAGLSDFTVMAWIRSVAAGNYQTIVQQRDTNGFNGEYLLRMMPDGRVSFVIFGDGEYQFVIATPQLLNDGAWHHVAAGREGARGFIFVDGVLATQSFGTPRPLDRAIGVGLGFDIRDATSGFAGSLDDVRIFDTAISPEDIATAGIAVVPQGTMRTQRPVFTWPVVASAVSYELWVERIGIATPVIHQSVAVNHFEATTDLGYGQFRTWVRGRYAGASWAPWQVQTFEINGRVTLLPIDEQQTTHRPELSWQAFPGADHYDIWIDDQAGGVSQFIRESNVVGTSWMPAADMPLGRYTVWVRAIASNGSAARWSQPMTFTVMPPPHVTAGNKPTFDHTPTFAWDALTGAAEYEVLIRNVSTGTTTVYQRHISALNFTPPTDLSEGPYRVWVLGVSAASVRSFWTDPISIDIGGRTEILTPVSGSTTGTMPVISWRPVDGDNGAAVTFEIWFDRIGVQVGYINVTGLTATSYTHGTPLPAGDYRVWVRAISSGQTSIWSAVTLFTVA
ncbi:MAG: hypothetical protein KDA96_08725 [Planctomycetaceae bacterium]|nr:hypothetical protein [Planctomycetaceae bacterium]